MTSRWVAEEHPAGRRVVMGWLAEPEMPYEAWFYGCGDTVGYRCIVVEPCLYANGEPMRDMRRVEFANGVRRGVMFGQLDWRSDD